MAISVDLYHQLSGEWVEPETGKRAAFKERMPFTYAHLSLRVEGEEEDAFDDGVTAGECYWSLDGKRVMVRGERGFFIAPFSGGKTRWFCRPGLDELADPPNLSPVVLAHFHSCVRVARAAMRHVVEMWGKIKRDVIERFTMGYAYASPSYSASTSSLLEQPALFRLQQVQLGKLAFGWALCGVYLEINKAGGAMNVGSVNRGILEPSSYLYNRLAYLRDFSTFIPERHITMRFSMAPQVGEPASATGLTLRALGDEEWRLVYEGGWTWSAREGFWRDGMPMDAAARSVYHQEMVAWRERVRAAQSDPFTSAKAATASSYRYAPALDVQSALDRYLRDAEMGRGMTADQLRGALDVLGIKPSEGKDESESGSGAGA